MQTVVNKAACVYVMLHLAEAPVSIWAPSLNYATSATAQFDVNAVRAQTTLQITKCHQSDVSNPELVAIKALLALFCEGKKKKKRHKVKMRRSVFATSTSSHTLVGFCSLPFLQRIRSVLKFEGHLRFVADYFQRA